MPDFMDRLRPLVGSKGWDYCVLWRINEDQRFLKWIACCCAGAETGNFNKQDELMFPVISQFPCRDAVFHHQRTQCCDLLSQLPSSAPLESGIYAEAYFSSQPRWLSTFSDPHPNKPPTGELPVTRLLIPVLGGLVELLVAKQVPEDHNTVDFVVAQCAAPLELDAVLSSSLRVSKNHGGSSNYPFHHPEDSIDLQACELSCFWQKMSSRAAACNGFQEMEGMSDMPGQNMELFSTKDLNDKDAVRAGACRSGSISDCSDQIDDEDDDNKCLKRNGKGQAKNLEAERRRRKKLNERLYKLRALVPIISKLDKAAILVDAIDYVKQLRKQVEELQEELEQDSDNNGADFVDEFGGQVDQNLHNPFVIGSGGADSGLEKVQQMEPKVEVKLVDASKFFIRVFCEQRPGGLVRMLEVFRSLGLEVVDVNVTSCRLLVSNVFQVEMKGGDTDQVVADDLRNLLVELTRIPFL